MEVGCIVLTVTKILDIYATYDKFQLHYECNCGSHGSALLDFEDSKDGTYSDEELIIIKNRFCCPYDESPLVTILSKNIRNYEFEITCKNCSKIYKKRPNTINY